VKSADGEFDWPDDDVLDSAPKTPDLHMEDDEVESTEFEYSDRHPTDWVVSGPLADNRERGRWFRGMRDAEAWCREKYGDKFIRMIPEAKIGKRWAALIKGER
jgi:hypothetical protein